MSDNPFSMKDEANRISEEASAANNSVAAVKSNATVFDNLSKIPMEELTKISVTIYWGSNGINSFSFHLTDAQHMTTIMNTVKDIITECLKNTLDKARSFFTCFNK